MGGAQRAGSQTPCFRFLHRTQDTHQQNRQPLPACPAVHAGTGGGAARSRARRFLSPPGGPREKQTAGPGGGDAETAARCLGNVPPRSAVRRRQVMSANLKERGSPHLSREKKELEI